MCIFLFAFDQSRYSFSQKSEKQKKPNEVPGPEKRPETIPPEEPEPQTWPQRNPEVKPEKEPLTVPPSGPPEVPAPPESKFLVILL